MFETYKGDVEFMIVYIREAHALDSRSPNSFGNVEDPLTDAERLAVAGVCMSKTELKGIPAIIDRVDDKVNAAYGAWPDRLYLVGRDGNIAYAGGQGPFDFKPEQLEAAIRKELAKPAPKKSVKLLNGKDLKGWKSFLRDGGAMEDVWSVNERGEMICVGRPIGYIHTKKKYTNFELTLEWRFDPEKGPGNSGVLLRRHGKHKVWPNSIEAQLHSRNAGDIWNIGEFPMKSEAKRTRGRRTVKAEKCNEKPLGEWNHYRIRMDHGTLTLTVNGVVQNVATGCEEIAGHIGLQSEGAEIHFRNIELTPLH